MTPAERITMAKAREANRTEAERQERLAELKRTQAKLRAITKRDSTMPARMVKP
jgi:hypothetical protein